MRHGCTHTGCCRQYPGAIYDWQDTNRSSLRVNIRVNDTDAAGGDGGPPNVQRWNQAMNLAANAFLTFSQVCPTIVMECTSSSAHVGSCSSALVGLARLVSEKL